MVFVKNNPTLAGYGERQQFGTAGITMQNKIAILRKKIQFYENDLKGR